MRKPTKWLSRAGLARTAEAAEKNNAAAVGGLDGWFFLTAELRMMSVGTFWGRGSSKSRPRAETRNGGPAAGHPRF